MRTDVLPAIEMRIGAYPRVTKYPVDFARPETHVRMLRNESKYQLFSGALAQVVYGKRVLDVGTGSGILALLSVAHGATRVVGVERGEVTGITKAVLERYRRGRLVELWEGDAFDAKLGKGKFDIIVSETIGYIGFEENIVPILSYARESFGSPGALVMPLDMAIEIEPCCIASEVGNEHPYLSLEPTGAASLVRSGTLEPVRLGVALEQSPLLADTWKATARVSLNAVAVYFNAGLPGASRVTNRGSARWPHCVVPFHRPIRLGGGETITCRLHLEASVGESYEVALQIQDSDGNMLEGAAFDSTEIRTELLTPAPNTVDAVAREAENVLRSLDLFARLA